MIQDYKTAVENIRVHLKEYLVKYRLKSMVVGVSGGIDSALTAALAAPVANELNLDFFTRSITIETNKPDEVQRSIMVGEAFGTDFKHVDLTEAYKLLAPFVVEDYKQASKDSLDYKIRMGNIKARLRMIYLYDLAAKNKGLVLSTDNYTELLLGFWTLHGDVGDLGMIQNLWKTEVYEMASFLVKNELSGQKAEALQACIDATPTDGLGITNSDLEQLKANSYAEVDEILKSYVINKEDKFKDHPVVQRYHRSMYKRNNPYNFPREVITKENL